MGVRFHQYEIDSLQELADIEGTPLSVWIRILCLKKLRDEKNDD